MTELTNDDTFGIAEVEAAAQRITSHVHRTPVASSATLNHELNAEMFFKCENLQKVGAFKFRGACNAIFSLDESELAHGVATHSSGNHAAALTHAASLRGVDAAVVMPTNASAAKVRAVKAYGGRVVACDFDARESTLAAIVADEQRVAIPPFDDYRVIAGQGTAALELIEDVPQLDLVLAPVGGGGLLAGTAIATRARSPGARVIGVEPEQADDAYRSFAAGHRIPIANPDTIADGLKTSLGALTFPIIAAQVDDIVCVSESDIVCAMRLIWERMKLVIEPSAAVPVAALLNGCHAFAGARIGIILSGGNVDLDALPWASL